MECRRLRLCAQILVAEKKANCELKTPCETRRYFLSSNRFATGGGEAILVSDMLCIFL